MSVFATQRQEPAVARDGREQAVDAVRDLRAEIARLQDQFSRCVTEFEAERAQGDLRAEVAQLHAVSQHRDASWLRRRNAELEAEVAALRTGAAAAPSPPDRCVCIICIYIYIYM